MLPVIRRAASSISSVAMIDSSVFGLGLTEERNALERFARSNAVVNTERRRGSGFSSPRHQRAILEARACGRGARAIVTYALRDDRAPPRQTAEHARRMSSPAETARDGAVGVSMERTRTRHFERHRRPDRPDGRRSRETSPDPGGAPADPRGCDRAAVRVEKGDPASDRRRSARAVTRRPRRTTFTARTRRGTRVGPLTL